MTRDFLEADPSSPGVLSRSELESLSIFKQTDYLEEITRLIRKQNADVLATAVVKGTSQLSNAITDLNSHEVMFEVGGKPVEVYKIFAFSTYLTQVSLSLRSLANVNDGIPLLTGASLEFNIPTNSVHIMVSALSGTSCIVNGPANVTNGGFFLYGFTVPDWDHIRNSVRG